MKDRDQELIKTIYEEYMKTDMRRIFDLELFMDWLDDIIKETSPMDVLFNRRDKWFYQELKNNLELFYRKWTTWDDITYKTPMDQYKALSEETDSLEWIRRLQESVDTPHLVYSAVMVGNKIGQIRFLMEERGKKHNFSLEKHL